MNVWLSQQGDALAQAGGVPRDALELSEADMETLLEIAALAAHESGERTNAPLVSYMLGRATAGGASLDELAAAVRGSTS